MGGVDFNDWRMVWRLRFVENSLRIIKETKTRFLLDSNGHPDKKISDHLPIVFEIKEDWLWAKNLIWAEN